MSRSFTAAEFAPLVSRRSKVYYQAEVGGATIGSVVGDASYDPFVSGSIQITVDQPVQQASFAFHLGKGAKSLSPYLSVGAKVGGQPLLYPGRSLVFKTAAVLPGTAPDGFFRKVFEGRIDSVDLDPEQDLITVKCRDTFAEIQDRWIDIISITSQGSIYGFPIDAARVDLAMQQVLDKVYGSTEFPILAVPTLKVQGLPTLAVSAYWQEQMGVLEALRRLGLQNGWDLRGRWDLEGQDSYLLTYYNPDRAKTLSDVTTVGNGAIASQPRYYTLKLSTSLANVRNVADVIPASDTRVPQRAEDVTSETQFGRRFAGLSEDRASHIDTDAEALDLAGIMVADLAAPPVDVVMEMPYYWLWELNDLFKVDADGFSYDQDFIFAVSGLTHTFPDSTGPSTSGPSTSVSGSLAARAAISEWSRGRKRLNQVRLTEPAGPGMEGDTWYQVDDLTLPTVL